MQEFTRVRVSIDSLIDGIKDSIKMKARTESMEQLEQARVLVQELRQMSTAEQAAIVAKRESTVASLAEIAENLKKPAVKKRIAKEALVQAATL